MPVATVLSAVTNACAALANRDAAVNGSSEEQSREQAVRATGATGLEPATSGVTGRFRRHQVPSDAVQKRNGDGQAADKWHTAARDALAMRLQPWRAAAVE